MGAGFLLTLVLSVFLAFLMRSHRRTDAALAETHRVNQVLNERTRELAESEERVRAKLEAVIAPEGDLETLDLADIIDCAEIQRIMDDFHRLTGIGIAIIDLKHRVLVATGWQDICVHFHRAHDLPSRPIAPSRCFWPT